MWRFFKRQSKEKEESLANRNHQRQGEEEIVKDKRSKAESKQRNLSVATNEAKLKESKNEAEAKKAESKQVKKIIAKVEAKSAKSAKTDSIFLKPLTTEKLSHLSSYDIYAFAVSRDANKVEVKKAFWQMYKVKPKSIRIINMPARLRKFGRNFGVQSAWKKALIRLPKGSKVNIIEGV